jgi:integrase
LTRTVIIEAANDNQASTTSPASPISMLRLPASGSSCSRRSSLRRGPWNKGKLVGAKPPLRPKHVWSIRTKLQIADRKRDLAMFNLAIDSKLRGCDVVALKVEDIAPHGYAVERATVRQKKTGVPVRFEVTEHTRQAVDDYIRAVHRKAGDFLFAAPRRPGRGLSTRQYARLVGD